MSLIDKIIDLAQSLEAHRTNLEADLKRLIHAHKYSVYFEDAECTP